MNNTIITPMSDADRDAIMVLIEHARKLKASEHLENKIAANNIARFLMQHHGISFEDTFGQSLF